MFDNIKNQASKAKKASVRKGSKEHPRTARFVGALKDNKLRVSYAALADASEALGEHEPSGLSAGQRGSAIVGTLPATLQPYVCRANGAYAKGQEWSEEAQAPSIKELRSLDYVRPERIQTFVQAFIAHEAQQASTPVAPEVTEEPVIDEETGELEDASEDTDNS